MVLEVGAGVKLVVTPKAGVLTLEVEALVMAVLELGVVEAGVLEVELQP